MHPDSNWRPIDIQSIVLPLTYTPGRVSSPTLELFFNTILVRCDILQFNTLYRWGKVPSDFGIRFHLEMGTHMYYFNERTDHHSRNRIKLRNQRGHVFRIGQYNSDLLLCFLDERSCSPIKMWTKEIRLFLLGSLTKFRILRHCFVTMESLDSSILVPLTGLDPGVLWVTLQRSWLMGRLFKFTNLGHFHIWRTRGTFQVLYLSLSVYKCKKCKNFSKL